MTMGTGDAPYLAREVVTRVINANVQAMLDEFPIYNLFTSTSGGEPQMLPGEVALLDIDYQERRAADYGFLRQPQSTERTSVVRQ